MVAAGGRQITANDNNNDKLSDATTRKQGTNAGRVHKGNIHGEKRQNMQRCVHMRKTILADARLVADVDHQSHKQIEAQGSLLR